MEKSVDTETGDITFTGVCVGIPATNTAFVNEKMTARAYVEYEIGGKSVYVYGGTNSASLVDVAKLTTSANKAEQDYIDSIKNLAQD